LSAWPPRGQQAAADHDADLHARRVGLHRLEILDRAVDEAAGRLPPLDRRHEGVGAGGQHQLVIGQHLAGDERDLLARAIDGAHAIAIAYRDAGALVATGRDQRQIGGALAGKERRQADAIVGRPRLFADDRDVEIGGAALADQELDESMPDHAISDDN